MEIISPVYSQFQDAPNQLIYNLPKRLGSGIMHIDHFSSGLSLLYMDVKPLEPIAFWGETEDWRFGIGFSIIGHSQARFLNHRQTVSLDPGLSGHFIYPGSTVLEENIFVKHKVKIAVLFDLQTLHDMASNDEESFLPFLKVFREQSFFSGQGKILPQMSQALNQIIACPYCGKTRTLFLEGKAMELLAYRLEQLKANCSIQSRQPRIKTTDVERIHYSAELLVRDPVNPPDITTLAGSVGMSRSKFYECFKIVYGHSPLDHLRSHRLRIAKVLLLQGRHNVTEAAFAVGYNNLGYFARLFFAEFGIPPHKVI